MLGLTLLQPWASLFMGPMDLINRTWAAPHVLPAGRWLAIHASSAFDAEACVPEMDTWIHAGWPDGPARFIGLPSRCILGAIRIEGYGTSRYRGDPRFKACRFCRDEPICDLRPSCSRWAHGPICWLRGPVVKLDAPIRLSQGWSKLWTVPADAAAVLRTAIAQHTKEAA